MHVPAGFGLRWWGIRDFLSALPDGFTASPWFLHSRTAHCDQEHLAPLHASEAQLAEPNLTEFMEEPPDQATHCQHFSCHRARSLRSGGPASRGLLFSHTHDPSLTLFRRRHTLAHMVGVFKRLVPYVESRHHTAERSRCDGRRIACSGVRRRERPLLLSRPSPPRAERPSAPLFGRPCCQTRLCK